MTTELHELNYKRNALGGLIGGAGRRLVFVHGFTQSAASWERVLTHLRGAYEIVAVDLPGHRSSSEVSAADLSATAALIGERGGKASYVGYSLGGRCCLTLALEHPELVDALVLIGATPGIANEEDRAARRKADEVLADRLDPADGSSGVSVQEFLSEWLAGPLFQHLTPEQADLASRLFNTEAGLADSLRRQGTGTQQPSYTRLSAISMPTLLLAGGLDERFSQIAREMQESIGPNATVELVPGTGHAAPFESPAEFAAILEAWLASH